MSGQRLAGVAPLEEPGQRRLRPVEAGGEPQGLGDGCVARRQGLSARGAALEVGDDAQSNPGYERRVSSPVTRRYQAGWCSRAHVRVTVPRVIEPNVPGSAAVPR